jgi:hypothetical protein
MKGAVNHDLGEVFCICHSRGSGNPVFFFDFFPRKGYLILKMKKILLAAVVFSCSGCTYATDRFNDFVDCFHADVGYGLGLEAHVVATDGISYCIGLANPVKYGIRGRYIGTWEDYYMGFPIANFVMCFAMTQVGHHENVSCAKGRESHSCFQWGCFLIPWPVYSNIKIFERNKSGQPYIEYGSIAAINLHKSRGSMDAYPFGDLINAFDFEAGFTVIYFGLNAGFNCGQFADFLLGFFGLDIADDDN